MGGCSNGHIWGAGFDSIKNKGSWCSQCANRAKLTIEDCKKFAESKQGKCLSNIYVNNHSLLLWKCIEGH